MKRRRTVNVFGMSFLDVMFCGFGSVILLVMLINGQAVAHRDELREDLRGEVGRLQRELHAAERYLAELDTSLEQTERELAEARAAGARVRERAAAAQARRAELGAEALARKESVERLKIDLKELDSESHRLGAEAAEARAQGTRVRAFLGEGDRQYLTGLKMGGERVLILVDVSASMLDETIVNVIRRRNMADVEKRRAAKWRRAVATVEWLLSQLPTRARVQIYTFDTEARALVAATDGRWIAASDASALDALALALGKAVPGGGTSLHAALAVIRRLQPAPDNVMLITDGLPTQGASRPVAATVSASERLRHFESAVREHRPSVPINTILLPMEGDPRAASAFWQLAGLTRGSLVSPAKDWP